MSLVTIDKNACDGCCACIDECPILLLEIDTETEIPKPIQNAEELCIDCGHCVAVCPHGALDHRLMKASECAPTPIGTRMDASGVGGLLQSRRSIRTFTKTELSHQTANQLLEVALYGPTGSNRQPVQWMVVTDGRRIHDIAQETMNWMKDGLDKSKDPEAAKKTRHILSAWDAGTDYICRGAPSLFVVYGPSGGADYSIAITYLEIQATAMGLGTCWGGWVMGAASQWDPVKKLLDLPRGNECQGAMMIGYPVHEYHRIPKRKPLNILWR